MSPAERQKAFKSVVQSQLNALYRTAWRMVGDRHEAEDAVQDALDKAWQRLDQLQDTARLKPWLFRILTNTCTDMLRSRGRMPVFATSEDAVDLIPDSSEKPDEALSNRQIGQAIEHEIARLPEQQQIVVQLVIVEQLSYDDAAQVLGVPVGTVRSRLSRARASLGHALSDVLDDRAPRKQPDAKSHLKVVK